jgi:hypothetical protein
VHKTIGSRIRTTVKINGSTKEEDKIKAAAEVV